MLFLLFYVLFNRFLFITGILYHQNFGYRAQTDECFQSDKGQKLAGYKCYKDNDNVKGVVVISHGYGGTFNSYMDVANYFTSNVLNVHPEVAAVGRCWTFTIIVYYSNIC